MSINVNMRCAAGKIHRKQAPISHLWEKEKFNVVVHCLQSGLERSSEIFFLTLVDDRSIIELWF